MAGKSRKKTAVKGQDRSLGAGIAYIALGVFFLLPFFMPEESSFGVLGGFLLSLFQGLFGNVLILVALFMIFTGAYGLFDPERVRKSFYVGVGLFLSGIFLAFHLSYIQPLSLDSLLAAYGDRRGGAWQEPSFQMPYIWHSGSRESISSCSAFSPWEGLSLSII